MLKNNRERKRNTLKVKKRKWQIKWGTEWFLHNAKYFPILNVILTLFRMCFLGPLMDKICSTYPTIMKIGKFWLLLKKIKRKHRSRDAPHEFCWHQRAPFLPRILNRVKQLKNSKFLYSQCKRRSYLWFQQKGRTFQVTLCLIMHSHKQLKCIFTIRL